jgi:hypothetical protein
MNKLDRRTFLTSAVGSALADTGLFNDSDMRVINRENAIRLLPRFV